MQDNSRETTEQNSLNTIHQGIAEASAFLEYEKSLTEPDTDLIRKHEVSIADFQQELENVVNANAKFDSENNSTDTLDSLNAKLDFWQVALAIYKEIAGKIPMLMYLVKWAEQMIERILTLIKNITG